MSAHLRCVHGGHEPSENEGLKKLEHSNDRSGGSKGARSGHVLLLMGDLFSAGDNAF